MEFMGIDQQDCGVVNYHSIRSWCCLLSINKIVVFLIIDHQGRCVVNDSIVLNYQKTRSKCCLLSINKIVALLIIDQQGRDDVYFRSTWLRCCLLVISKISVLFIIGSSLLSINKILVLFNKIVVFFIIHRQIENKSAYCRTTIPTVILLLLFEEHISIWWKT